MTASKFNIGDKVRFTKRVPSFLRDEVKRGRTRTVVSVMYDSQLQCSFYELGGRGRSTLGYLFRGYQLKKVTAEQQVKMGRPKTKRRYTRRHDN